MTTPCVEPTLAHVFIENRPRLRRIAQGIVRTPEQADDVLQDAYLKLIHGESPRQADRPLCYCSRVVRNLALDYCRKHSVEANYRCFDVEADELDIPDTASPEQQMRDKQVICSIDRALAGVPAQTRQAFELYRLEGLTQREIAKRMGCALGLVNAWIADAARAIAGCRHLLADD
ncbi:RNA polymerase subunit sigma-70 [Roseateles chitinivorans]|jgi:RNA polymerase sigma factor (sigma-70 family)|uniref:RNA polymerase subunit sigma-70 n=1 Tax=Roseateles chitinivorans TaxID=2917965 RepID=A0A2G9C5M4_9BURK|nr:MULTISPECIES: sigma-70 family RNA polymerase sigma factor [Roseateles]PIM51665.1 RNA polymerase subunit sigma-70 [Roseateles chitinivorans]SFR79929.1 RNA polymerase sigma-70 factor, ECF subfamily [Mitsuaria sp. PDC51]